MIGGTSNTDMRLAPGRVIGRLARFEPGSRTNSGPCATGEIEGTGAVSPIDIWASSGAGEQERVRGAKAPIALGGPDRGRASDRWSEKGQQWWGAGGI